MARREPNLRGACPRCGKEGTMNQNADYRAAANISVMECPFCEWDFCKDQSVKIPGNLVKLAAYAMEQHEGFSSLGDYVRDCVRTRSKQIEHEVGVEGFGLFMEALAENPEMYLEMLRETEE